MNKSISKRHTPFAGGDKWKQLRETISEVKTNNKYEDTAITEFCTFLLNYMAILEREAGDAYGKKEEWRGNMG